MDYLSLGSHSIYFLVALALWAINCVYRYSRIPTIKVWEVSVLSLISCTPLFMLPRIADADILWVFAVFGIVLASYLLLKPKNQRVGTLSSVGYLRLVHFPNEKTKVVRSTQDLEGLDVLILSSRQLLKLNADSKLDQEDDVENIITHALLLNISVISLEYYLNQKYGYDDIQEDVTIDPAYLLGSQSYRFLKKLLDVVISIILLILLTPLFILTAALIWICDGDPILYKQERLGKGNRKFQVLKFRTMEEKDDGEMVPSRLGRILRISHIDELPQLLNIVRGEMALVGPRPEWSRLTSEQKAPKNYWLRQAVRPGLTGWAQVNYRPSRNKIMRRRKLGYDMFYIKNRSFFLDALIYLRTVKKLTFFWKNTLD